MTVPVPIATAPFVHDDDPRRSVLERGYAFLPGLLDPARVLHVRSELLRCAGEAGWLAAGSDVEEGLPGEQVHDERDVEDFLRVYRPVQAVEAFHELAHTPELLDVVDRVLGEPAFCLPFKIARFSFPNSDLGPTAPHQDYYYIQGSTDTLTAWVPLGPVAAGGGRLIALAGSHRLGPLPPLPTANGTNTFWIDTSSFDLEWHGVDYRPGDVLLFHSLLVHGAEANGTDRLRVSADYRFQPVADPISEVSLEPHFLPGEWEQLYRGWTGPLRWYWRDLPLDVRPVDTDVDSLRRQAGSRLLSGAR